MLNYVSGNTQGDVAASSKMSMRLLLKSQWANWRMWYKMQPLDYIRFVNNDDVAHGDCGLSLSDWVCICCV